MAVELQQDATDWALQAFEKSGNTEQDVANFLKREFDKTYSPAWHCVVGRNFGSYVSHESDHYIYFYVGQTAVLLFRSEAC